MDDAGRVLGDTQDLATGIVCLFPILKPGVPFCSQLCCRCSHPNAVPLVQLVQFFRCEIEGDKWVLTGTWPLGPGKGGLGLVPCLGPEGCSGGEVGSGEQAQLGSGERGSRLSGSGDLLSSSLWLTPGLSGFESQTDQWTCLIPQSTRGVRCIVPGGWCCLSCGGRGCFCWRAPAALSGHVGVSQRCWDRVDVVVTA